MSEICSRHISEHAQKHYMFLTQLQTEPNSSYIDEARSYLNVGMDIGNWKEWVLQGELYKT